ncbi:MAG: flagellin lysine-N-methylase [Acutalibacteraceae bacterium]|nr:flagellin lysine-N-methylase [Acutalibacteraceae bacterium]
MKTFAPSYYKKFKCIADKCKNNCCIGWEIDVDENTLDFYKDKFEIVRHIDFKPVPHFRLAEKERCPLLDKDNLCEIIKNYGEEHLCQICTDHPRYKNYYNTRLEIGIGLCCEAAAKLIIDNPFELVQIADDNSNVFSDADESDYFVNRDEMLRQSFNNYINILPDIKQSELYDLLINFEILDESWKNCITKLKNVCSNIKTVNITNVNFADNLISYFIYRHLSSYDIMLCTLCVAIIFAIGGDIYDTARMFSAEIEYSDENLDKLYNFILLKEKEICAT